MKRYVPVIFMSCCSLFAGLLWWDAVAHAQTGDESFDPAGYLRDQGREDTEVEEVLQHLRYRAQARLQQDEFEKLTRINVSAAALGGYETNPLNTDADASTEKADSFVEEKVNIDWVPMFSDGVGADIGYHFYNQDYTEMTDLDSMVHAASAELKLYPDGDKNFAIQPGAGYEWVDYPNDELSVYQRVSPFIKLRYSPDPDWTYGLKYEFSEKEYDSRLARDNAGSNISDLKREDERHTGDVYVTRYWENYFIRFKGRFYHNDSNDAFQSFYDYNSYRGQVTLGASLLNDKLDLSVSPSYEKKDYDERAAGAETREDDIIQIRLDAQYKFTRNLSCQYGFGDRISDSNVSTGDYANIINTLGLNLNF